MTLTLTSTAFSEAGNIPAKYTCSGEDVSPPLSWQGVPAQTKSLVLIVDDPDAPDPQAPKMTWVHWVLYNIPTNSSGLEEAASVKALPAGTCQGSNDWHKRQYGGPCPPIGRHRYVHKLFALDTVLPEMKNADKASVEAAMRGHIIESAQLIGTYSKSH